MKIPAIVMVVFYWGRREQKINDKCNKQVSYIRCQNVIVFEKKEQDNGD